MSDAHSITTTIDTNEGWTFTNDDQTPPEFPTTTNADDGWGEAPTATTTDGWGPTPAAPSPPLSAVGQPRQDNHASMHWTACYNDDCTIHRSDKDFGYYPRKEKHRRRRQKRQQCDCPHTHPFELAEVIRNRHMNQRKACADWRKGKRVCPRCQYLVNPQGHQERCQTNAERTPLEEINNQDQENQEPAVEEAPAISPVEQQENANAAAIQLLREQMIMIYREARNQCADLEQQVVENHTNDREQMQRVIHTVEEILQQQRRLHSAPPPIRHIQITRSPIRRRRAPARDLAGASVWSGGVLSRIWRDRLLAGAAGAILTLVGLGSTLISLAAVAYLFRH